MPMDLPPVDAAAILDRMASVPYVLEAPASPSPVRSGAIAALAKRGFHIKLGDGNTAGIIGASDYQKILDDVRGRIAEHMLAKPDHQIELINFAAPDKQSEIKRLQGKTDQPASISTMMADKHYEGGEAHDTAAGKLSKGRTCFISPLQPWVNVDVMLKQMTGTTVDRGDMTIADFHKSAMWHELGHCMLGSSELKADLFAALMTTRYTQKHTMLQRLAAFREANELIDSDPFDLHNTSKAVWHISEMQDDLRANPDFMLLDIKGLAALADRLGDKYAYTPDETVLLREARVAFQAAVSVAMHYKSVNGGLAPVDVGTWIAQHPEIEPFNRLVNLTIALSTGGDPGPRPEISRKKFHHELQVLANNGDPTAKTMIKAMTAFEKNIAPKVLKQIADDNKGWTWKTVPFEKTAASEIVAKEIIAFDPKCQTIMFNRDQSSFAVKDKENNRVVSAGHVIPARDFESFHVLMAGRWRNAANTAAPTAPLDDDRTAPVPRR